MLDATVFLAAAGGLDRIADARAVHQDTFLPVRFARLGKACVHIIIAGHIDLAEHAANFGGHGLALLFIHVEDRDLGTLRGQCASRRCAQSRRTASYDCRGICTDFHQKFLSNIRGLERFNDSDIGDAAAFAHRLQAILLAVALKRMNKCCHQLRT